MPVVSGRVAAVDREREHQLLSRDRMRGNRRSSTKDRLDYNRLRCLRGRRRRNGRGGVDEPPPEATCNVVRRTVPDAVPRSALLKTHVRTLPMRLKLIVGGVGPICHPAPFQRLTSQRTVSRCGATRGRRARCRSWWCCHRHGALPDTGDACAGGTRPAFRGTTHRRHAVCPHASSRRRPTCSPRGTHSRSPRPPSACLGPLARNPKGPSGVAGVIEPCPPPSGIGRRSCGGAGVRARGIVLLAHERELG